MGDYDTKPDKKKLDAGNTAKVTPPLPKLIAPDQMGSRFKAVCLAPHGTEAPPGF